MPAMKETMQFKFLQFFSTHDAFSPKKFLYDPRNNIKELVYNPKFTFQ